MCKRSMFGPAVLFGAIATLVFAVGLRAHDGEHGAVYALTNSPTGNAVVAYHRAADGSLKAAGSYLTGGLGTGAGLGSQGAVIVTEDRRWLLAVNAGSNSISLFRIRDRRLKLVDLVNSGGTMPTSLAARDGLVYVLNAAEPNNITGFRITPQGGIKPLARSTRPLSAAATSPAQVGFSEDGGRLIVTERATNIIDTFALDDSGRPEGPFIHVSAGPTPFGFAVSRRNTLFVSEAGAGGGASTYRIEAAGLDPISAMIMTGQRAACWAIVTPDGRFGYVTNAGTGNISGVAIDRRGAATLLNDDGVTAATGGNPTDMAMSEDGRYLYARVAALNEIAAFKIRPDGSLAPLPAFEGTPANLAGLAGF